MFGNVFKWMGYFNQVKFGEKGSLFDLDIAAELAGLFVVCFSPIIRWL